MREDGGLIDGEPLPVMVWIHGGAFRIGKYQFIFIFTHLGYDFLGRGFASEESGFLIDQNVLLVSINYRFLLPKYLH